MTEGPTSITLSDNLLPSKSFQPKILGNDLFSFSKPFVPKIIIDNSDDLTEEKIKLTSGEENIYYLQRKDQTSEQLKSIDFFESINELLTTEIINLKPALNNKNTVKYASIPEYSSMDYAERVFKILFFIQNSLNSPKNNNKNHHDILLLLKKISLLNYNEFNNFTDKFYNKNTFMVDFKDFKNKMMSIKSKINEHELFFNKKFNSLINVDLYRLFFINLISFLRVIALFMLGIIKNTDKMSDGILKKMFIDISNMRILKNDKNIVLKDLNYTDFIPTQEELSNKNPEKVEAKSYKIRTLLEFLLLMGSILYNYFGGSSFLYKNNTKNKEYFEIILDSITKDNPLYENIFKESFIESTIYERNFADVLSEYLKNNTINLLNLVYKNIIFFQIYCSISWFYITPGSIYEIIGLDTIYDTPLLNQYINAGYIGKKLNKAGRESIKALTPISLWSLLWTKNSGINKKIRLYNYQYWSFTVIAMNYEGENFFPFAIAGNKSNMESVLSGTIPKSFFNQKDEYQFHFFTKSNLQIFMDESLYGTEKSILKTGSYIDNFLKKLGWIPSSNKLQDNKNNKNEVTKSLNTSFDSLKKTIKSWKKDLNKYYDSIKRVNDYKVSDYKKPNNKADLLIIIDSIEETMKNRVFKNKELLDKFIIKQLDKSQPNNNIEKNKIGYYILYYELIKLYGFLDLSVKNSSIINMTPFAKLNSKLFKYKILDSQLISKNNSKKEKSMHLFPIGLRESESSNKILDTGFYITENGYVVKADHISEGQLGPQEQMVIHQIEFILVKKIKNENLKTSSNSDDNYSIDIYNHEFYVVKVNPGSRELVILGIINMEVSIDDTNNNNNNKNKNNTKKSTEKSKNISSNNSVFDPHLSNIDINNHLSKVKKNIIDNFKKGNDKLIDITIGDTVISPLDLTFMITLCRYLMTQTGAGIGFGGNKFNIKEMVDYYEIFNSDNTTKYDSTIVQNITNNGLRSSFSPVSLFNPKSNMSNIIY